MNTKEAISILKKNGINTYKRGDDKFLVAYQGGMVWSNYGGVDESFYSGRELVRLARCFTSDNRQNTAVDKNVKEETRRTRRAYEKRAIGKENFDSLSSRNDSKQFGDRWNWD